MGFVDSRGEVHASEATVEVSVEANSETLPEQRRRFALMNALGSSFFVAAALEAAFWRQFTYKGGTNCSRLLAFSQRRRRGEGERNEFWLEPSTRTHGYAIR
jgi:hypothetical protein